MRLVSKLLAGAVMLLLLPSAAHAASDIEAVWEFGGGAVAVTANGDGTYTGTVTKQTTLVRCPHPDGEQMWTDITPQPDGQYFGGHQWFVYPGCKPNPNRGKSAFRVLPDGKGGRFLKICLSNPSSNLQPSIAPDGTDTNTAAGCINSMPISALPQGTPTIAQVAPDLPPSTRRKSCASKRKFTIHLRNPKGDPLESARVYLNGNKVKVRKHGKRLTAKINLRGKKKGRYTVRIVAKTVLGKTVKAKRHYKTCARKRTAKA
jgi:hypothetical protein